MPRAPASTLRCLIEPSATLRAVRDAAHDGTLAALCDELDIEVLVLFGSSIHRPDPGDVDLAAFAHGSPVSILTAMEEFAAAFPGDNIDLMDLDRAGPVARQRALTRGEVLYRVRPAAFSERQIFAMREFMEPRRSAMRS